VRSPGWISDPEGGAPDDFPEVAARSQAGIRSLPSPPEEGRTHSRGAPVTGRGSRSFPGWRAFDREECLLPEAEARFPQCPRGAFPMRSGVPASRPFPGPGDPGPSGPWGPPPAVGLLALLGSAHARAPRRARGAHGPSGGTRPCPSPPTQSSPSHAGPPPAPWFVEREDARVRVRTWNGWKPTSEPTSLREFSREQRAARLRQMDRLAEYRRRGDFPGTRVCPDGCPSSGITAVCSARWATSWPWTGTMTWWTGWLGNGTWPAFPSWPMRWNCWSGWSGTGSRWTRPHGSSPCTTDFRGGRRGRMGIPSRYRSVSLASGVVGGLATAWNLAGNVERGGAHLGCHPGDCRRGLLGGAGRPAAGRGGRRHSVGSPR
jgi:hypothetical protein